METESPNESSVEYEYHDTSQFEMNARQPTLSSRPSLSEVVYDKEYLNAKPKISSNRHASFSNPEVVYYDVDPDFEPDGEYFIYQILIRVWKLIPTIP